MEKHFISLETTRFSPDFIKYFGEDWSYGAALKEQLLAFDGVQNGKLGFKILSGVHGPVYTLGNSIKAAPISDSKIPFVKTDRGGQLMHHGPGQLTLYPVFNLKKNFAGPREYSKFIFDTAINHFKKSHNITLKCQNNGLWLEGKKVGFLGLRIKNGIVYHGLSLNYWVDLTAFKKHSPCDISGDQAGNLFVESAAALNLESEALELSKAIALKLTI